MSRYTLDGDDLGLVLRCAYCGWESWIGWLDADEDELERRIREHLQTCAKKEQLVTMDDLYQRLFDGAYGGPCPGCGAEWEETGSGAESRQHAGNCEYLAWMNRQYIEGQQR